MVPATPERFERAGVLSKVVMSETDDIPPPPPPTPVAVVAATALSP